MATNITTLNTVLPNTVMLNPESGVSSPWMGPGHVRLQKFSGTAAIAAAGETHFDASSRLCAPEKFLYLK